MKYKFIIVISLLMFVSLAGFFFIKGGDLLTGIRQEIINQLEKKYQVKFEVQEAVMWPLNQIMLKKVTLVTLDDTIKLKAPSIEINYNFMQLLTGKTTPLASINYLKIKEPDVSINSIEKLFQQSSNEITWFKPASIEILVEKGKLEFITKKGVFNLADIDLKLLNNEKGETRLQLSTGLIVNGMEYKSEQINRLDLGKVNLSVEAIDNEWSGELTTGFLDLNEIGFLIDEVNRVYSQVQVNDISGKGKLFLKFKGRNNIVNSYHGFLEVKETALKLSYKDNSLEQQQKIKDFNGMIAYDSDGRNLFINNANFNLSEMPFHFEGSINLKKQLLIEGALTSSAFNIAYLNNFINKYKLVGNSDFTLNIYGNPDNLNLNLSLSSPLIRVNNYVFHEFDTFIRYIDKTAYIDRLDLKLGNMGDVKSRGMYNIKTGKYSFDLSGSNVPSWVIQDYIPGKTMAGFVPEQFRGDFDFEASMVGTSFNLKEISLQGEIKSNKLEVGSYLFDRLETSFWMADGQLLIQDGKLESKGNGSFTIKGETDLINGGIDFAFQGNDVNLQLINTYSFGELGSINGKASLTGKIEGSITEPVAEMKLEAARVFYSGYMINDLNTHLVYKDSMFDFKKLAMNYRDASIDGSGIIKLADKTNLDMNIKINNFKYGYLKQISDSNFPINGNMGIVLAITGDLKKPEVNGYLESGDTVISLENSEKKIVLSDIKADFNWEDRLLTITQLRVISDETLLIASGKVVDGELAIDYQIDDFSLTRLLPEQLAGKATLFGNIIGKLETPVVNIKVDSSNITFNQGQILDELKGQLVYNDQHLTIGKLIFSIDDREYYLNGNINNLLLEPKLDLRVSTEKGNVKDFVDVDLVNYPLPEYFFRGDVNITGTFKDVRGDLNFNFYSPEDDKTRIQVKGNIGQEFNLQFEGEGVEADKLANLWKEYDLEGIIDFNGNFTGNPTNYSLQFSNVLHSGSINGYNIKKISGELNLTAGKGIYINQFVELSDDGTINISGYLPENSKEKDMDLDLVIKGMSADLLPALFKDLPAMNGYTRGEVSLKGSINNPQFNGQILLFGGSVELGLPEKITRLQGNVNLAGQTIILSDIKAFYGSRQVRVNGKIYPFNQENTWDINLTGKKLNFNYGSFNGKISPDIKITGSMFEPYIKGDVLVRNTTIGLPISWPVSEKESPFSVQLDLNLIAGKEIYLSNDNIDIMVQEGTLNILREGNEIQFMGTLSSEQGSFDYYNNKFMVTRAEAVFRKYNGFMPDINAKAWTKVSGTRITINLNGPANNMIITFTSQPSLSEEEILMLLTKKGGIGKIVSGNISGAIESELLRVIYEKLQLDFVGEITTTIQELFDIDRMEMDIYNLGWEQEVFIYAGKQLNDRLYLQFSSALTSETIDNEWSLKYYIDDNLMLGGSWEDKDNYKLSIETGIDF